jgi:hypothetical protein
MDEHTSPAVKTVLINWAIVITGITMSGIAVYALIGIFGSHDVILYGLLAFFGIFPIMAISGYWYDAAIMESATKSTYNSYKINDLPLTGKIPPK